MLFRSDDDDDDDDEDEDYDDESDDDSEARLARDKKRQKKMAQQCEKNNIKLAEIKETIQSLTETMTGNATLANNKFMKKQLEEMKHSLGLNYKKVPYRNRFFTNKNDSNWNDLVNKKLAVKVDNKSDSENCCYFYLTKFGAEYAYGKSISDNKYKEL